MTIPESQLITWSHQGATVTAEETHKSIRNALATYNDWPEGVTYDTYLQGSYRNSTNIYGNSDVDLVVELTSVFWSNLTPAEKQQLSLTGASYNFDLFRQDVISALSRYYGSQYIDISGKKSVKVLPNNGRLKADVVVCGTYRHYENMKLRAEGITFWTQNTSPSEQIINYPKLHYANGAEKNSAFRTDGWYRCSTRMFKNARERLYINKPSLDGKYPSYYVECLLYNVPERNFGPSFQDTFANVVNWLNDSFKSEKVDDFVCQNGMYYLFGPLSVQWNKVDAHEFIRELIDLWNNW